jgi:hypothetical protein
MDGVEGAEGSEEGMAGSSGRREHAVLATACGVWWCVGVGKRRGQAREWLGNAGSWGGAATHPITLPEECPCLNALQAEILLLLRV